MKIQNKNCGNTGKILTKAEHTLNETKNPTHKHYYSKTQNLQDTYHQPTANALYPPPKGVAWKTITKFNPWWTLKHVKLKKTYIETHV